MSRTETKTQAIYLSGSKTQSNYLNDLSLDMKSIHVYDMSIKHKLLGPGDLF